MSINTGVIRELQKTARGKWNKVAKFRQSQLVDLGLVLVDEYGGPTVTTAGAQALKEQV